MFCLQTSLILHRDFLTTYLKTCAIVQVFAQVVRICTAYFQVSAGRLARSQYPLQDQQVTSVTSMPLFTACLQQMEGKAKGGPPGVPGRGRVLDALAELPDGVPYVSDDLQVWKVDGVYNCTKVVYMYHLRSVRSQARQL